MLICLGPALCSPQKLRIQVLLLLIPLLPPPLSPCPFSSSSFVFSSGDFPFVLAVSSANPCI